MRVVIAPDSFKGSLDAHDVATALAAGWAHVRPHDELILLPQADGGEGTLDAIASCYPGSTLRSIPSVTGPDGRSIEGEWLVLPDSTAVVELAQMSGLPLMAQLDPGGASTTGLGEVISAALDEGAHSLVIGLGGSASTDGGAGALRALGAELLDRDGRGIGQGGQALLDLASVHVDHLRTTPPGGVELLTDTSATLTGSDGAAEVFGPQKGADSDMVVVLDRALGQFAETLSTVLTTDKAQPGSGAAGGTGFGLAAWGGRLVPGAPRIAELTGLTEEFGTADVIVTGEGRFDRTSLTGKLVGSILSKCHGTETAVVLVTGQLEAEPPCVAFSLADLANSVEGALGDPRHWLQHAASAAAHTFDTAPKET